MRTGWAALVVALIAAALLSALMRGHAVGSQTGATPSARAILISNLRAHIKHVFVIYQENHSFDEYFGTYPGADNLATAQATGHGFRQYDPIGKQWVTPFRITDPDTDSPSHGRASLLAKIDGGANDRYIAQQENDSKAGNYDAADQERAGLLTMAYYDCDTLPILWNYAHNFTLFDHFFQGMTAPSTPGNIEIIAAQTGQTQWARAQREGSAATGDPITSSIDPAFGPYPEKPGNDLAPDQTYATLLLNLNGTSDAGTMHDADGVRDDLALEANSGREPVPWGWYQEGYADENGVAGQGYVAHHNAVQYFGYMRQNSVFWKNVHDTPALLDALASGTLPDRSVVFVKGGSSNHFGWRPANADPFIQKHFLGDDDHPGIDEADRQIGQSFVATFVNAIARSKYWNDSAIIITWDDSGGFFDHETPPQFEKCPDGNPCGDGPRLPFILISPYAKSGAIVHDVGDTSSVVKFVETLFGLPPLASLPDESPYMPEGPRDANDSLTDLMSAFDQSKLQGTAAPIPNLAAVVDDSILKTFPTPMNCKSIGITPVTLPGGSTPPPGYGPRALQYKP